jgi:beta-alanine--pyruvate transaminase
MGQDEPPRCPLIELESDSAAPGRRGYEVIQRAFWEQNVVVRVSGDTIALSPPLSPANPLWRTFVERIRRVLDHVS